MSAKCPRDIAKQQVTTSKSEQINPQLTGPNPRSERVRHHFPHLWCAAPPGAQEELVEAEPERFFRRPYVGGRGWLGLRLDVDPDWDEIGELCEDAFRQIAPRRLVALL